MQIRQMLQCHVDKDNIKDKNQEKKYQKNNYNIKMRTRTTTWFECKIRYEKMMDDGMQKKVTELYVVDALTFTEAESAIIEEMSSYISGEFEVRDIKKAPYGEIFFSDEPAADRWYKAKLQFITIDEKTEKEKRSNINYLVHAATFNGAVRNIDEVMGKTMIDYSIASVAETQIMDVFEHGADMKTKKVEQNDVPEYEQNDTPTEDAAPAE